SSEDLAATIGVFYHELETLSITPRRCGVGLLDKENHTAELSTMNTREGGGTLELIGKMKLIGHPVLEGIYDNWILQKEYHPVLRGNEIKEYHQVTSPQVEFPEYPNDTVRYGYFFYFSEGGVYAWTEKELSEDELKTYRRFTSVLSLTYKRYKDLKDAEAREREAIRQASLDRVRAEIASMRSVKDLERITPLIWRELTTLGIPFVRCGVFIMDNEQQQIHTYLTSPDGKAIVAAHQSFQEATTLSQAITAWQDHRIYVTHWEDKNFQLQADTLMQQGAITSREQYLSTLPKEGIYLHFLPFLQGMLYVGNTTALHTDDLNLVHAVADAFSTAYARYEDFVKLEQAKQSIETTLSDLKATQKQLIQSEKMASLGELTAGIAHEIQNPLNFVNNFSEVNEEIIDEIKGERAKDEKNEGLINDLLNDLQENSNKINHHGQRASSIVKGMLEHSRTSTGQKVLTDINSLADEYLRLSYHGLRAKEKSFNANFRTDFDPDFPKIEVIPQDIGRVFLNLINNAFQAVDEKAKNAGSDYKPTVTVSTESATDHIEIQVSDNGGGIPESIKDKIFQPFFTTKDTGKGTGLGLSLAYDIVKAHGGQIKVETEVGEGSLFIITLPVV
ncbi:MAG: ATP-binding protein, partial [Saprospiraceae bacterium]